MNFLISIITDFNWVTQFSAPQRSLTLSYFTLKLFQLVSHTEVNRLEVSEASQLTELHQPQYFLLFCVCVCRVFQPPSPPQKIIWLSCWLVKKPLWSSDLKICCRGDVGVSPDLSRYFGNENMTLVVVKQTSALILIILLCVFLFFSPTTKSFGNRNMFHVVPVKIIEIRIKKIERGRQSDAVIKCGA